ncbi:hypothetical protein PR370_27020, partial [Mycobacterium marinum]|nr:hypothetical protein [Mycobacterium marinum]MDC9002919.1 hypothetical protein [Mycobacterium marinum]MDC9013658.1 hypothetical protein [Mycobacterium marinum]MDC9019023.1 hypothetical protein [Mycobacterium marinum]
MAITAAVVDGGVNVVFCNLLDDGQRWRPACGIDGTYRDTAIRSVTGMPVDSAKTVTARGSGWCAADPILAPVGGEPLVLVVVIARPRWMKNVSRARASEPIDWPGVGGPDRSHPGTSVDRANKQAPDWWSARVLCLVNQPLVGVLVGRGCWVGPLGLWGDD